MTDDAPLWVWKNDDGAQELSQLWSEYQYRHEHVWKMVFQATLAVVVLSFASYIPVVRTAGLAVFLLPVLAIGVAVLALVRMDRELRALTTVKDAYLDATRDPKPDKNRSRFRRDVVLFMWGLAVVAVVNLGWMVYVTVLRVAAY
ncbi:MAG: hypothetical protein QNI99_11070 [Woeseiaceae bacterium]|nr:hypothetical protein [Woeseiaceae bacterium]